MKDLDDLKDAGQLAPSEEALTETVRDLLNEVAELRATFNELRQAAG